MRPRRDPRAEREAHRLAGGAGRLRFDWASASAKRPRRDPRRDTVLLPGPAGRPRLDRSHAPAAGIAAAPVLAPAREPEPIRVEDAALRILVVADPGEDELTPHDRQCLAAARRWADASGGVVLVADRPVADAGRLGADRLVVIPPEDHPASRFERVLAVWDELALPHILCPESEAGGDLARRLAARTDRAFFAAAEAVSTEGTLTRAVPGRGIDQIARSAAIVTLAKNRIAVKPEAPREGRAVEVAVADPVSRETRRLAAARGAQPLAEADFVAAAGNGVADLALFRALAEALGATPGASRMLCDAGLMPRAAQVGASGTVLMADCYLALGIAGAPQHLQGIAGCRNVVAVNTDLHAAMVERASLAVVADAGPVMRAMLKLLQRGE
ncbi:electron transfer flavoprotein subunit alpha/FixB family protein [Aureimonas jatrophae]|uniref:Electron transfer flavoprotein alpha subunit apoprotein n=1 Tax=Aureimonas jatrophae TaxID=1166073 RepID=A0A1H0DBG0_9HYPH|nr:electron transfer flavoprotein subunit alpha/FixB family protein [Aureimonas jatrophae]MBB3951804.1 electron transfer flavoprotein alpha subunit [Aureimonas jatrophae]SDN67567.1 electron transfer flavoprotein alpha subunit apoprotein [Aureimonas jatrophae]